MEILRKLFKREQGEVVVAEPISNFKGMTTNEIIEEIHESFYTEVDRLLAEAKIDLPVETTYQELIDKSKKLEKLGFRNTLEVKSAKGEIERLDGVKIENATKKVLVEAINYFSMKYPNYKFITEESVQKICAKYNLIYSEVGRYIGDVPDKNIKQMEDFKIKDEDAVYKRGYTSWSMMGGDIEAENISHEMYLEYTKPKDISERGFHGMRHGSYSHNKAPLEIAAPLKDFNTEGMELKGFKLSKIEIPDPVVLQPVYFKGIKHYLIVTAWGIEASDELIVNQKMN